MGGLSRARHRHAARLIALAALLVACKTRDVSPPRLEPPRPAPSARPAIALVPAAEVATAEVPTAEVPTAEVPIVLQTGPGDCGPAALTMTLNYYGRGTSLDAVKAAMQFNGSESSANDIVQVAQANGLGFAGVSADADAVLAVLQRGDILYVDFDHFIVVDRVLPDAIQIVDPGMGRRTLHRAGFGKHYSGIALLFASTPEAMEIRKQAIGLR